MSGKGAKGLITGKSSGLNKDKDKKVPVSRSSRAGLQVYLFLSRLFLVYFFRSTLFSLFNCCNFFWVLLFWLVLCKLVEFEG